MLKLTHLRRKQKIWFAMSCVLRREVIKFKCTKIKMCFVFNIYRKLKFIECDISNIKDRN